MKVLVEDSHCISINRLKHILGAKVDSEKIELEILKYKIVQEINIVSTPANFGGSLKWFLCPGCYKRAGKLYMPRGQRVFLCRFCYNLGYRTQYKREFRKTPYVKQKTTNLEKRQEERTNVLRRLLKIIREEQR